MPSKKTVKRARKDLRQGKKPSTAAGEFVKEEFDHIRQGKHGARSAKQAIAIGLSKARRSGVPLKPPKRGSVPEKTRKSAERAYEVGQRSPHAPSPRRSRASLRTLRREGRAAGTRKAISSQVRASARKIRRQRTSM